MLCGRVFAWEPPEPIPVDCLTRLLGVSSVAAPGLPNFDAKATEFLRRHGFHGRVAVLVRQPPPESVKEIATPVLNAAFARWAEIRTAADPEFGGASRKIRPTDPIYLKHRSKLAEELTAGTIQLSGGPAYFYPVWKAGILFFDYAPPSVWASSAGYPATELRVTDLQGEAAEVLGVDVVPHEIEQMNLWIQWTVHRLPVSRAGDPEPVRSAEVRRVKSFRDPRLNLFWLRGVATDGQQVDIFTPALPNPPLGFDFGHWYSRDEVQTILEKDRGVLVGRARRGLRGIIDFLSSPVGETIRRPASRRS